MSRISNHPLRLEQLEQKRMLAGDVLASVNEGVLVLEGDDLDNQVAVTAGANPGEYVVAGLNGTTIILADDAANAAPDVAVVVEGVRHGARIGLKGGDDLLVINDANFNGTVAVDTGLGEDRVVVGAPLLPPPGPVPAASDENVADDAAAVHIRGSLVIHTGADADVVRVGNARVGRNLAVGAGAGDDTVLLGAAATPQPDAIEASSDDADPDAPPELAVGGHVYVNLAAGSDSLAGSSLVARRGVVANGGLGHDEIGLHDVHTRRLGIHGGAGDAGDLVNLTRVDAAFAAIATRGGNDRVNIGNSSFGVLGVRMGAGDDQLTIGDTNARLAVLLGGVGEDTLNNLGGNHFGRRIVRGFELPPNPPAPDPPVSDEPAPAAETV